ncbi:MAG TPA: hypothetical protein VHM91_21605, partial [Verrucomicrobiales bacterium]|nr:hypothetical protein [Verrucomicrobiales bacterium]
PSLTLELPGGLLGLELAPGTSLERAEEIADYLNLVIHDVSFSKRGNIQQDLERLNEEQPVSVAVEHP